jgi:hypothetical protein
MAAARASDDLPDEDFKWIIQRRLCDGDGNLKVIVRQATAAAAECYEIKVL